MFTRRAFIAGCLGAVAGTVRAADLDNFPTRKTAAPLDNVPKLQKPPKVAAPAKLREPIGHTHTCSAGHSWDHTLNPGHTCTAPVVRNGVVTQCGLYANVWDNPARMVPTAYSYEPAAPKPADPTPTAPAITLGGCQGGNCPSPSTGRFRLFPRLRE